MKILAFTFFLVLMMTEIICGQAPPLEPGVSETLAKWRAANYSDVRYKLNITLEKGAPTLKGTIEIRVKLSEPPAAAGGSAIILDWRKIKGKEDLSTISNVSMNGKTATLNPPAGGSDLRFEESNEHLIFKDGVTAGENVIKLDFTTPIATSGAAITRYVDKEDGAEYVYSLFVPSDASTAFPVFDQPDLKARFQLGILAPQDWKVVSNERAFLTVPYTTSLRTEPTGEKIEVPSKEGMTYISFAQTKPISTYVFAFAAGDFAEFDCRGEACPRPPTSNTDNVSGQGQAQPLQNVPELTTKIYVRKSQAEKFKAHAAEVFRLNREGVKFLESYFDYKFPFPKYDIVLIPEFPFGGMEHAGATFLREASVIFPSEPTKNDLISRANVIFHEAAHQWFGDTVTMKWFDDLWLKEGFAEFMAYKTLEKVMPEYNAWKAFYERNKPLAYLTDSTRGTTPIYQEIPNLSAAKSAYGNIVYRKAPAFLRQAEFYLGEDKFQTAVRAFLKKHEYANAEWTDLVKEFETASNQNLKDWANVWVKKRGLPIFRMKVDNFKPRSNIVPIPIEIKLIFSQSNSLGEDAMWMEKLQFLYLYENGKQRVETITLKKGDKEIEELWGVNFRGQEADEAKKELRPPKFIFTNYQDYGYGIFLFDEKSRDYVVQNIGAEKDGFLRSMMWGTLWDSVREAELNPKDYVELAIKNISVEEDESTIQAILGRVGTAMNYYIESVPSALADGSGVTQSSTLRKKNPPANAGGTDLSARLEKVLEERITNAKTAGQRITFYRAYLSLASSATAAKNLKDILAGKSKLAVFQLRTKDKFDIVTRLLVLGDKDAPALLANLEKTETSDDAKRYAYAARAGIGTAESKAKYFRAFLTNKEISESWIEAALSPFNSSRHSDLTLPYLETALAELPNLKKTRKIFFVNGWLGAFLGGQKSEEALATVNKFLADNQNLDKDLRLKILENVDNLERAVKIRAKYGK
jgi:aminopeptidase N